MKRVLKISVILLILVIIHIKPITNKITNQTHNQIQSTNESIEIEVSEPYYLLNKAGVKGDIEWEELAFRQDNLDFRLKTDSLLDIISYNTNGKNGVLYIDENGKHTNNSTLYNVFMNQYFVDNYWNNTLVRNGLKELANTLYTDLNSNEELGAFVNGYWNLFNESLEGKMNGYKVVSRSEFLSAVYKSFNPVEDDLYINKTLMHYIDKKDEYIGLVSQMLDKSYLNTDDKSLNDKTYYGAITKAEAVYTIVRIFYEAEYQNTTGSECLAGFTNGGNIALEQGIIQLNKLKPDFWKSNELVYAIENDILPNDLYRALIVADKHDLLDDMMEKGTVFKWSEGITKSETLRLLIDTFVTLGEENGYLLNSAMGTASPEENYESLSCLVHVTYDSDLKVYTWTEEWETAIRNFGYFDGAPEDIIQEFLQDFAEEGYNKYSGEEVHGIMNYLTENGFLYE